MAKKKRKHFIKINNKIKALFGKPFDDAVKDFNEELLMGLAMNIKEKASSIPLPSLNKKDIIKFLRRVWSEGEYSLRKNILIFLEENIAKNKKEKKDKVDLILSFIEKENPTHQEKELVLAEFIDKKISKLVKEKILNKLTYIRMKLFLDKLSEKLDINFTGDNSFEFNTINYIKIEDTVMPINITYQTNIDISLKELLELDIKRAKEYLSNLKEKSIQEKEKEIKFFNNHITTLSYFNNKDLINIFKNINKPISNLYHCPIPLDFIKRIFNNIDKDLQITCIKNKFIFSKEFETNIYNETFKYFVTIKYDKNVIYSSIWTNQINDLYADLFEMNKQEITHFKIMLNDLKNKMVQIALPIEFESNTLYDYIKKYLKPLINNSKTLNIKSKTIKKIIYLFNEEIKPIKDKQKQEELLAKTIKDFKQLFPVARGLNREIIFHVGPTNSGKTYSALQELKKATTGVYLAPLRLLALEGYENLKSSGINASLITGEEEIINEESTHISSTIEMLNGEVETDVCIIDEIQMIGDRDRGWAWANALIGAPAKKIILTGSKNALEVVKEIAKYLNEPLKIIEFKRKNPLTLMDKPTPLNKLEPATAIVTFSRKEVLALKNKISSKYNVSVVYGNLSPEVRKEEAKRFKEGKSDILIATDAISMGLNLPIKTILFAKDNKFDGVERRELTTSEILQIAGRAGRYGIYENGLVGALDFATLSTIKEKFNKPLELIKLPVAVMASLEHVILISEILQTQKLSEILEFFANNMEFEGPFIASNIESMQEIAKIVDDYNLDLVSKYHLSCAPVSLSSPYLEKVFHNILKLLEENKNVPFKKIDKLPKKALTYTSLLNAEDRVKEVSLYLWLSFKFSDKFLDVKEAKEAKYKLNEFIERSLKESNFIKYCKKCGRELDITSKFLICDDCYYKNKKRHR